MKLVPSLISPRLEVIEADDSGVVVSQCIAVSPANSTLTRYGAAVKKIEDSLSVPAPSSEVKKKEFNRRGRGGTLEECG